MDPADYQKLMDADAALTAERAQQSQPQPNAIPTVAPNAPADGSIANPAEVAMKAAQPVAQAMQGVDPEDPNAVRQAMGGTEPGLGDPTGLDAIAGGAMKGIFETKDFVMGEPTDKSEFRKSVEHAVDIRKEQSIIDGFAAGISQFAIGMIGLGKAKWAAEGLSAVEKGFSAIEATKKGVAALETAKAATVGAVAFDPHEERLSNLVQDTPLANPITQWLSAKPGDSAAEGRIKAALESIGLDATLMGVFLGSTKVLKALKAGKPEEASRLVDSMQAEQKAAIDAETATATPPVASEGEAVSSPSATGETPVSPSVPNAEPVGDIVQPVPAAEPVGPKSMATAVEPDIAVSVVDSPTQSANAAGVDLAGNPNPTAKPKVNLSDENTQAVYDGMVSDVEALQKHGGWEEAVMAGHVFGKKQDGIPYHKLNSDADVDDFISRTAWVVEERLDSLKGGAVLSDSSVQKLIDQRVALYDEDPALLLGMIQQSGANASRMVADMEAGYLVSARMFQDAHALAMRIKMGDFIAFGGKDQAIEALKHRLSLATSVYGAARSITANAGRGVRRMRREFAIDPNAVKNLAAIDGDRLVELINSSAGNPRNMAKLANATLLGKTMDFAQFLLVNNLVSGPKTQLINILSNSYMVGVRPLERILGSIVPAAAGDQTSQLILKEAVKQYSYMGSAFTDAFGTAVKAFTMNDSILAPHKTEFNVGNQAVQGVTPKPAFKPWDGVNNLIHNVFLVATAKDAAAKAAITAIGLPTRTLGAVDELVKQTVYRSKVMANAHISAVEEAGSKGLEGDAAHAFIKSFVIKAHDAAFDAEGKALDTAALREAQIASFQQDLLPGTLGKTMQTAASGFAPLKLILPFIKTPTNILRYGWKMTPGLNMLQEEYRNMLHGNYGAEAQAQAIGQMSMGSLFMGTAAFLVSNGSITGGGPSDYKQRQELLATGWQPYSVVKQNADGSKTYIPFGRLDPVAVPFGIIADLQDAIHNLGDDGGEDPSVGNAIGSLVLALSKQFTDKTYLSSLKSFTDTLSDPERNGGKLLGNTAANFIPFSSFQRQVNSDPYMRDARSFTDKLMSVIPGLSESIPAKYDAFGDPIVTRKGLWSSDTDQTVDREVQRLIMESGSSVVAPIPNQRGVDLRDITTIDGQNAFERYQQLAAKPTPKSKPLKEMVAKVMTSAAYRKAPDGDVGTKGTKLWILHPVMSKYREAAMKILLKDPLVRHAIGKKDTKVREAYKALKQSGDDLAAVGSAFGVDLDALAKSGGAPSKK